MMIGGQRFISFEILFLVVFIRIVGESLPICFLYFVNVEELTPSF